MKFHIVSDSSCDLGREEAERLGVSMVSFYVAIGDETYYREERDISTQEFYRRMAQAPGVFPKTSMPTMDDYLEAFRPAAAQGLPMREGVDFEPLLGLLAKPVSSPLDGLS